MLKRESIIKLAEEKAKEIEAFLVDVIITTSNKIIVEVDSFTNIRINDCATISRYIESNLDREIEDFELEVSSPGLESPFKVFKQYQKAIGKKVSVLQNNGIKIEGELLEANEKELQVKFEKIEKNIETKKKQKIIETKKITLTDIKQTKRIISFK
jgi:ribosome maturation factor RimP